MLLREVGFKLSLPVGPGLALEDTLETVGQMTYGLPQDC